MLTRKTQYGWMALGGLICLFGLVLACKLRDGNKAVAQVDKPALEVTIKEAKSPLLEPPSASESKANPSKLTAPADMKKSKSELPPPPGMSPFVEPPPKMDHSTGTTPPGAMPPDATPNKTKAPSPPPPPSGLVLPVSFSSNTPTSPLNTQATKAPPSKNELSVKPSGPAASPPPPLPSLDPLRGSSAPINPPKPPPSPPPAIPTETKVAPTLFAPVSPAAPRATSNAEHEAKSQPGEPPLAPDPGPVQIYHVHGSESLRDIAQRTLGSSERWTDLHKLNPTLKTDAPLSSGTTVRLPGDACMQTDDVEPVKPLPILRAKTAPAKAKVLPLTGTFLCSLDEKGRLTLPRALRDQLAGSETVLVSPGPDKCLWLTNHPHLERLAERLEQSRANEADVRVFKRLYFAQTEKLSVNSEGRVQIPERLAQFAGLHQELVLVGIDDHFEVWDSARWRQYTRQKSASASRSSAATDSE